MSSPKERVTVTLDADLLDEGRQAVARGEASSVSSWVNAALRERSDGHQRGLALDDFIAAYEAEEGVITQEEMDTAWAWASIRSHPLDTTA